MRPATRWMLSLAKSSLGACVAFVGAGFSAAVCRLWGELLGTIAAEAKSEDVRAHVQALLAERSTRGYEMAAQILEDAFKDDPTDDLLDKLRRHTRRANVSKADDERMKSRRALLTEIPFAAVLTTNFDDELQGDVLDSKKYALLLRDSGTRWVERRFWKSVPRRVLKLHGDLARTPGTVQRWAPFVGL